MNKVRIYYECLEQANFFLKPIVRNVLGDLVEIELIEISKAKKGSRIAKLMADALAIRNPDGIVTMVKNQIEIPLVWIEFTTQVETFDHMAQSFNSFGAAGRSRIPLIKYYAKRESRFKHGGGKNFNDRIPFQILYREFSTPGIQLNWPVTEDKRFALRDQSHKACPIGDLGLEKILKVCISGLENNLLPADALIDFALKNDCELAKSLKQNMEEPEEYAETNKSTRFFKENKEWTLKINRWEHSMDPERGICELMYYWVGCKLNLRIHDKRAVSREEALHNFERGTGIKVGSVVGDDIDISQQIIDSNLNRSGLVVAWYGKKIVLADKNGKEFLALNWKIERPVGLKVNFSTADQTQIYEKTELTEDDVTFVVANRFFPANGFDIQSVSYPGAQGDFALVTGTGRSAARTYFDVIAYKTFNREFIVALTEVKGKASMSIIEEDLKSVLSWRDDVSNLRKFLLSEMNAPANGVVLSSLAYCAEKPVKSRGSDLLDFVILVSDRNWEVWAPYQKKVKGIDVGSGESELPLRYKY